MWHLKNHTDIQPWEPIVPKEYPLFKQVMDCYLQERETVQILIVDDIDTDGFGSAKICLDKLSKIFPNCTIHINHQHGFDAHIQHIERYDLVIIVDSSSSLLETYEGMQQVIILDHHEYDHNQQCPSNVLLINSKDTPELKSISAGMLVYLVCSKYLEDHEIAQPYDMFDIACMTLYSDIVPVDDYVQRCLYHFMVHIDKYSSILMTLNYRHLEINKNTLSYNIIPLLNYTRRLNDKSTLQLLYRGQEEAALQNLKKNREDGLHIIDICDTFGETDTSYEHFVFCDITSPVELVTQYPTANFKGVLANRLSERYNLPTVVGYAQDEKFYISVRSNKINSLDFFQTCCLSGGGHKPACGFVFDEFNMTTVLKRYDQYLINAERDSDSVFLLNSLEELQYFNLFDIAVSNEFRYSNFQKILYHIPDINVSDLSNIDNIRGAFSIGALRFNTFEEIPTDGVFDLEIEPCLESYHLKKKKLLVHIMNRRKG